MALIAAGVIGLVNGLLVTYGRLSGIVVTLGMMFVLEGINTFLTGGYQVAVSYSEVAFAYIGQGKIGYVAFPCLAPRPGLRRRARARNQDQDRPLHFCGRR